MKYYNQKSIGARVTHADEAIRNAQTNPDLTEALALQGYAEAELAAGRELVDAVKAVTTLRREQLGAQTIATGAAEKVYRELRLAFDADRRQFRLALSEEPDYIKALRLSENVGSSRGDFTPQARYLYETAKDLPAVMDIMQSQMNITPEYLERRLQQVASLEEAFSVQLYLIGQTREAQKQRREAIEALDAWMKRFIAIARVAFSEDRPKLAKLGIVVKSNRGKVVEEQATDVDGEPSPETDRAPEADATSGE